jgi:hypothetical protein
LEGLKASDQSEDLGIMGNNIKIYFKAKGKHGVDWIHVAQEMDRRRHV